MTLDEDDKRDMLRTFIRGGSITAIAQIYACKRDTAEDVIREGTQQILQRWIESEQAEPKGAPDERTPDTTH